MTYSLVCLFWGEKVGFVGAHVIRKRTRLLASKPPTPDIAIFNQGYVSEY